MDINITRFINDILVGQFGLNEALAINPSFIDRMGYLLYGVSLNEIIVDGNNLMFARRAEQSQYSVAVTESGNLVVKGSLMINGGNSSDFLSKSRTETRFEVIDTGMLINTTGLFGFGRQSETSFASNTSQDVIFVDNDGIENRRVDIRFNPCLENCSIVVWDAGISGPRINETNIDMALNGEPQFGIEEFHDFVRHQEYVEALIYRKVNYAENTSQATLLPIHDEHGLDRIVSAHGQSEYMHGTLKFTPVNQETLKAYIMKKVPQGYSRYSRVAAAHVRKAINALARRSNGRVSPQALNDEYDFVDDCRFDDDLAPKLTVDGYGIVKTDFIR